MDRLERPSTLVTAEPVTSPPVVQRPANALRSGAAHAARGALIGSVELVPGVSGGTVALVLGVFDRLINSAHHLIGGVLNGLTGTIASRGRSRASSRFAAVEWSLILPLAIGMLFALFALSGPLHTSVETQPVISKALLLGMVTASLSVPLSMAYETGPFTRASKFSAVLVVLIVALAAFLLLGLPTLAINDPSGLVIVLSGAAAVCVLAIPGLSGSFILLTFGMYEPTLEAVSTRNGGYLAMFIVGALLGLVSIVQLVAHLLRVHRRPALLVATGLILGSLRALWPWQEDSALLTPPTNEWTGPLAACLAGAVLVLLLWWQDRRRTPATTLTETRA